jgi:maltooligosyltrehalose trehalohydrolase
MNGATVRSASTHFRVWAPDANQVTLKLLRQGDIAMCREDDGHFSVSAPARAGDRYFLQVDDHKPVPDPVSRFLPEGVHGPTEIVDPDSFQWADSAWRGLELRDYLIYELHVGTFTPEGTFDAIIGKLDYLKRLNVSVIELMPVAAFPGTRNWGYDGVAPYAVQASYGGPDGLKRLIDAAHRAGIGVMLDVVYNHLGNEGNYLRMFGPYFTDRHHTPWGEAINYDGPGREGVRRYVVENALYWVREYHMDGLRLDAVQTIYDDSRPEIVAEIAENVDALAREPGRKVCVIAETDENDARYVRPRERGGCGLAALWSDDFHHAAHTLLTGERNGYYQDFGKKEQLAKALEEGFVFQGEHFQYWGRPRGTSSAAMALTQHIIALQNHDQVGNRAYGERLTQLLPLGARRVAASLLCLAPHTVLIFMGQEFGEPAPFLFFTSYGDPALQQAVREGRRREFQAFNWKDFPDPEDPQTFEKSKLHWELTDARGSILPWYRQLLELRRRVVLPGERTCRAEVREDGAIVMSVPAREPKVTVVALGEGALPAPWCRVMASDQDGYKVSIWLRD